MERMNLSESLEICPIVFGMWRVDDAADTTESHVQSKIQPV